MILRRLLGMNLNGKKVLDCGCGTGILGIVASRLGADRVLGYDIDEWSSENAKHNASINGVGNLDVMLGDASVLDVVDEEFDVVIANINRNILINDMSAFKRHMKNDGCLILSGFYESDVPMLDRHGRIRLQPDKASLKRQVADLVGLGFPCRLRDRAPFQLADIIMHIAFRASASEPMKENRKEYSRQCADNPNHRQDKVLVRHRLID